MISNKICIYRILVKKNNSHLIDFICIIEKQGFALKYRNFDKVYGFYRVSIIGERAKHLGSPMSTQTEDNPKQQQQHTMLKYKELVNAKATTPFATPIQCPVCSHPCKNQRVVAIHVSKKNCGKQKQ